MEPDDPLAAIHHPLRAVFIFFLLIVISIIATVIIPAWVANHDGVFYARQLQDKLRARGTLAAKLSPVLAAQMEHFKALQTQRLGEVAVIDAKLAGKAPLEAGDTRGKLLEAKAQLLKDHDAAVPPVKV